MNDWSGEKRNTLARSLHESTNGFFFSFFRVFFIQIQNICTYTKSNRNDQRREPRIIIIIIIYKHITGTRHTHIQHSTESIFQLCHSRNWNWNGIEHFLVGDFIQYLESDAYLDSLDQIQLCYYDAIELEKYERGIKINERKKRTRSILARLKCIHQCCWRRVMLHGYGYGYSYCFFGVTAVRSWKIIS